MFGYVKILESELKIKELALYRSVYCGLCRSCGKHFGLLSRSYLSYDMTFLALCRLAQSKEEVSFQTRRCLAHPTRRDSVMMDNESLRFTSAAMILMVLLKAEDDIRDEKGWKALRARLVRAHMSRKCKKASRMYPGLYPVLRERMDALMKTESGRLESVDIPAEAFGEALSVLFTFGLADQAEVIMHNVGLHLGKWIYMLDALDDFPDDVRKGAYNPYQVLYQSDSIGPARLDEIRHGMSGEASAVILALDLIEDAGNRDYCSILKNILTLGMEAQLESIVESRKKNERSL